MKNSILKLMIFGFLSIGLKTAAGAQSAPVDKPVKYGEKYSCTVKTADEKNYLLDIAWSSEPSKISTTPKWVEKLTYVLTENSQIIDQNNFSDASVGNSKADLAFGSNKYVFAGDSSYDSRVGANSHSVNIEIKKSYDNSAKTVLNIVSFKASHIFDRYYGGVTEKTVELAIVNSECSVSPADKD
ncbi:hypothetical protein [Pseudobdellovibrio sp. HCB154]|uniref:hypothetical protein n=1 Tax=Pseudobdellovibrio sp. HCB154 TaxID=3386277 RepID=UPI003917339E